jgi:hypothetical protein
LLVEVGCGCEEGERMENLSVLANVTSLSAENLLPIVGASHRKS